MSAHEPVTILLVEDNPDHAELALRALKAGMLNDVRWIADGAEALDYLHRRGRYAAPGAAPRPGLILLDIKLPKVDGHEVLRQVKSDPDLKTIPIVMLTTSGQSDDVEGSYRDGANSFITKPVNFAEFMEKMQAVKLYWMLTNVASHA